MTKFLCLMLVVFISPVSFAGYYPSGPMVDTTKPLSQLSPARDTNILVVLDGKIYSESKNIKSIDEIVKPDSIRYVNVLKGKEAVDKYGERAKDGAVEIFTNNYFEKQEKFFNSKLTPPVSDYDMIFEKVDIEASFPGGDQAWRKYLEKTLNAGIPVDRGAPVGIFTTYIQFIVGKDGNISDVRALTNLGYGMEEEVIKVIKAGPKWTPASQSGRWVKAYRKQPVTFMVEDEYITVTGVKAYTLIAGKDNQVAILMDKVKDEDLELSISNGSITRISEGKYNIRVESPGRVILTVVNKKKKKETSRVSFEVK